MNVLPTEIIVDIVKHLDSDSVLELRQTSRSMKDICDYSVENYSHGYRYYVCESCFHVTFPFKNSNGGNMYYSFRHNWRFFSLEKKIKIIERYIPPPDINYLEVLDDMASIIDFYILEGGIKFHSKGYTLSSVFGCAPPLDNCFYILRNYEHFSGIPRWFYEKYGHLCNRDHWSPFVY